MRKGVIIGLVLVTGIMLVSASYAHFPGGGYGGSCFQDVDMDSVKKFIKETYTLRDEFLTKSSNCVRKLQKISLTESVSRNSGKKLSISE